MNYICCLQHASLLLYTRLLDTSIPVPSPNSSILDDIKIESPTSFILDIPTILFVTSFIDVLLFSSSFFVSVDNLIVSVLLFNSFFQHLCLGKNYTNI